MGPGVQGWEVSRSLQRSSCLVRRLVVKEHEPSLSKSIEQEQQKLVLETHDQNVLLYRGRLEERQIVK